MAFEAINIGATNLTAADIVRRNALPIFSGKPAWEAMFSALGTGDDIVAVNNQLAFDQLFLSTASEQYLDRILADRGFIKPISLTFTTETLRDLAIRLSAGRQTTDSLNWLLSALHGYPATRAYVTGTVPGPYDMSGPWDRWEITIDGTAYVIYFAASDFLNITSVPVDELVNVVNIKLALLGSQAFAATALTTHGSMFRLYSGTVGIGGSIYFVGGAGSYVTNIMAYNSGRTYYTGDIVEAGNLYVSLKDGHSNKTPAAEPTYWTPRTRWTLYDNSGTKSYLSQVQLPDIYGTNLIEWSSPPSLGLLPSGATSVGMTIGNLEYPPLKLDNGFVFPKTNTNDWAYGVYDHTPFINYRVSAYVKMDDGFPPILGSSTITGDFCLVADSGTILTLSPATQYIGDGIYRVLADGGYSASDGSKFAGVARYSGQSGRGFTVTGFQALMYPVTLTYPPYCKTTGIPVLYPIVTTEAGPALEITLPITPTAVTREKFTGAYLQVGNEVAPADLGTLDAMRATYMATAKQAVPSSAGYGPYLWDATASLIDYSNSTTLTTAITKYSSYASITVANGAFMPSGQEFWIVIGQNSVYQTQPIRVLNRTANVLWMDGQYQFQATIPGATATVYVVADRSSGVPANPEDLGSCYITGTTSARAEAVSMIENTKAAGIPVTYNTVYPGDRGLAGEGGDIAGPPKLSDKIWVWGSDTPHTDWIEALNG